MSLLTERVTASLRQIIGGPQRVIRRYFSHVSQPTQPTMDMGAADYKFWDRARKGRAKGLELSGLLIKPICSKIASWMIGQPPTFKLDKSDAQPVNDWWTKNHAKITQAVEDSLNLGDMYLVVNSDLSLTVVSPDVVHPIVADNDFSNIIGWEIANTISHPTGPGRRMTITDRYTATERTHTVVQDGVTIEQTTYQNLIGRVPVVLLPNARSADERFGRPEAEALVPLLQRYGDTLETAITGNKRQGRPTPVVEKMGDEQAVERFWERYGQARETTLPDGTVERTLYIPWNADQFLTLSGDSTFRYAQPGLFASDTQILLQLLYYLYLEHIELPEWVLGSAIASSQASANTQVEPLVKFIEKKRALAEMWIIELVAIVMAYQGVIRPNTQTAEIPQITWENLTEEDAQLTRSSVEWAYGQGLLDDETALRLLPLDIDDPQAVLKKARDEGAARQKMMDQNTQDAIQRALDAANRMDNPLPSSNGNGVPVGAAA